MSDLFELLLWLTGILGIFTVLAATAELCEWMADWADRSKKWRR